METSAIPIGRAIGDRRVYVVDPSLNLMPVGVPGEICIAGRSVARGYLKQAALTAEKFLPNPFSEKSGDRLYCTGDLAVRRVDGRLEFMGRLDHQVKVRGYRIELGEIEATLQNHEQVKHAVVIVQEDAVRGKRLVAHVVGNNETGSLVSAELRRYLEERLPDYMVPSTFVVLKELPLLATGKIDRKALLEPQSGTSEIDVVPSDEMELKLTTIWEDLLGVSHVGRRQSFFELGGHSLLAIKLVRRIKEQFGQELPLSIFLEHPTIEQMSIVLRQSAGPVVRSNLVPIHARGSKRPLFFIHPGGGGVAGYRHLARLLGDDQPFYGLQALDDEENRREDIISVEERATMYLKNLREAQPQGPYLVGGWSFGGYVAYEMARQLVQQKEEMAGVILFDISARPPTQPPSDGDDAEQLLELAKQTADLGLALLPKEIHGPQERLQNLVDQLIAAGILMPETDLSQVGNFVRGLRRRILSIINYKPGPYSGTVVLVRALEVDPVVSTDYDPNDPTLGFARLCSEPVQVHFVPGRHGNLIFSPQVEKVAEVVKESLRELELRVCSPVCTT